MAGENSLDPAPPSLASCLAGYCDLACSEDDALNYLNRTLLHLQRTKSLEEVVTQMGPYLTNEDGKVGLWSM